MAKQAIILDALGDGSGRQTEVRIALWAAVPVTRQRFYANAAATSAFLDASAAEQTAIQTGAVAESVTIVRVPPGSSAAQLRTAIQAAWQAWQDQVTLNNPWARYGSTLNSDGTWNPVTVA